MNFLIPQCMYTMQLILTVFIILYRSVYYVLLQLDSAIHFYDLTA